MFHPWEFGVDLSIDSKHFSFHISIFLMLGLPLAHPIIKTSQHVNSKHILPNEKSYFRDEKHHIISVIRAHSASYFWRVYPLYRYMWFLRFWSHFCGTMHCLPQRLKSTLFEIFSNGTAPRGVDFSLWGNRATTQNTFFEIFKWDQNHENHT